MIITVIPENVILWHWNVFKGSKLPATYVQPLARFGRKVWIQHLNSMSPSRIVTCAIRERPHLDSSCFERDSQTRYRPSCTSLRECSPCVRKPFIGTREDCMHNGYNLVNILKWRRLRKTQSNVDPKDITQSSRQVATYGQQYPCCKVRNRCLWSCVLSNARQWTEENTRQTIRLRIEDDHPPA